MAGERHPDASEVMSPDELRLVFAEADRMIVKLDPLGRGGWNAVEAPEFMGRLVRTLTFIPIHISNFTRLNSGALHERTRGSRRILYCSLRRVKNHRALDVPVSHELMPWLPEFLDMPKPRSRSRYNQLLASLGERLRANQHPIHLNPHRMRHVGLDLLHREFDLPLGDLCRVGGTTLGTMEHYIGRPMDEIALDLLNKGW